MKRKKEKKSGNKRKFRCIWLKEKREENHQKVILVFNRMNSKF